MCVCVCVCVCVCGVNVHTITTTTTKNIPVWAGDKETGGTQNAQIQILDQQGPVGAKDGDTHQLQLLAGLEDRRGAPRDGRADFLSRNFAKSAP